MGAYWRVKIASPWLSWWLMGRSLPVGGMMGYRGNFPQWKSPVKWKFNDIYGRRCVLKVWSCSIVHIIDSKSFRELRHYEGHKWLPWKLTSCSAEDNFQKLRNSSLEKDRRRTWNGNGSWTCLLSHAGVWRVIIGVFIGIRKPWNFPG